VRPDESADKFEVEDRRQVQDNYLHEPVCEREEVTA